jgi:glycosyltransferase involved in cell wall biosynthesis
MTLFGNTSFTPLVSVVITTKNEETNIENCLKSIYAQNYPKECFEVIVVDNQSSDRTKEIAQKFTPLVFDKGSERSEQRNFGIFSIAQGEYSLFLDADMILAPNLIQGCVQQIQKSKNIALHIPEIILGKSFWSQVRRFERKFYNGTVVDGARFFRVEEFKAIGGFDETLSGPEDWDLDKKFKQRGSIGLVPIQPILNWDCEKWCLSEFIRTMGVVPSSYGGVVFHNESQFNLITYLEKKGYYSKDMNKYIEKWGRDDPDIQKQLGFGYRFFGVFVEKGKWRWLLSSPILALGMYFLRITVGIRFLLRGLHG